MDASRLGFRSLVQASGSAGSGNGSGAQTQSSYGGSSYPADQARVLMRAPTGRLVSLSTCAKICIASFAIGVFFGFTLKRRLKSWAGRLLKRMKED